MDDDDILEEERQRLFAMVWERPATEVRDLSRWSRGPGDRGETDRDPETLRERRILGR